MTLEEQLAAIQGNQAALQQLQQQTAFAPTAAPSASAFQNQMGSVQATPLATFLSPQIGMDQMAAERAAIQNQQASEAVAGVQAADASAQDARQAERIRKEEADAKVEAARQLYERQKELRQMEIAQRAAEARAKAAEDKGTEQDKITTSTQIASPSELEIKEAKRLVKELPEYESSTLGFGGNQKELATNIAFKAKAIQANAIANRQPAPSFPDAFKQAAALPKEPTDVVDTPQAKSDPLVGKKTPQPDGDYKIGGKVATVVDGIIVGVR